MEATERVIVEDAGTTVMPSALLHCRACAVFADICVDVPREIHPCDGPRVRIEIQDGQLIMRVTNGERLVSGFRLNSDNEWESDD